MNSRTSTLISRVVTASLDFKQRHLRGKLVKHMKRDWNRTPWNQRHAKRVEMIESL